MSFIVWCLAIGQRDKESGLCSRCRQDYILKIWTLIVTLLRVYNTGFHTLISDPEYFDRKKHHSTKLYRPS